MARTVLSLALLACLGLAIIQLVSGEQQKKELEATSNEAVQAKAEDVGFRVSRKADAKKRRSGGKKGRGNGKQARKGSKRRSGKKKGNRHARKGGNGNGKRKEGKRNGKRANEGKGSKRRSDSKRVEGRQECNEKELCKRIKLYIKYTNQLRKAKRILKTCKLLKTKSEKAATAFKETADALADSDDSDVGGIQAMLKNCSKSAAEACNVTNVAQCSEDEQKKITECSAKLKAWVNAFGPGKASCLGNEKCCSCINGISLDVPADCLNYEAIDESATLMKGKCTKNEGGGGKSGSFGECRKKQIEAAVKGPKAMAKKCKKGGMTSAAPMPTQRDAIRQFRKALKNKKNIK